jgi:hypothetical protein
MEDHIALPLAIDRHGLGTYVPTKESNLETVAITLTGYHQEVDHLMEPALCNSAYTVLYKSRDMAQIPKLVDEVSERQHKAR